MAWLEMIDIHSSGEKSLQLEKQLRQLHDKLQDELKDDKVKVFQHITLGNDYSIHLYHDGIPATHHIHPTSMRLISMLKKYGQVHHTFWIEQFP